MQERTSKQLLFVESIIFLVPVSLLTGLYALFLTPMYASGGFLAPNYLAVPALVPFIHLMIERWHSGRTD